MFQAADLEPKVSKKTSALSFPTEYIRGKYQLGFRNPLVLHTRVELFLYPYTQTQKLGAAGTRVCAISLMERQD